MQVAIDDHASRAAQAQLYALNSALKKAGLSPLPDPDESKHIKVTPPTHDEIREAARAAKGDPGASAKVQTLQAREWLATHQALHEQTAISIREALQHAKDSVPELMKQLQAKFKKAAATLEAEAKTELGGITNLNTIDFSGFNREQVMRAYDLGDVYREANGFLTLWQSLQNFAGSGKPREGHLWAVLSNPTVEQYMEAKDATPQTIPEPDPWKIAQKGWPLELASSTQEVIERVDNLSQQYEARKTRPKPRAIVPEPYKVEVDGNELFPKTKN